MARAPPLLWLAGLLVGAVAWSCFRVFLRTVISRRNAAPAKSVTIVVLGDLGRSPRMMYHARSFSEAGWQVYLVGYAGTPVLTALQQSESVRVVHIQEAPKWIGQLPRSLYVLVAPIKVLLGALGVLYTLSVILPVYPRLLMVQTPPALPTLPVVQIIRLLHGSKLVIDWHNTAWSILALRTGNSHPLVRLAKRLEALSGRTASVHLFVTDVMRERLSLEWHLRGNLVTFHDRSQASAKETPLKAAHALFGRYLGFATPTMAGSTQPAFNSTPFTACTVEDDGRVTIARRSDRPALIVSSTSWTPDEDFSILLDALARYDAVAKVEAGLPDLSVIITGKGPLRSSFERVLEGAARRWEKVGCRTIWLESDDYPLLLGAADLGISLHASSSGLDLPMKILDMHGSGLPVLALDFACINEVMEHGKNGFVFRNSERLTDQLISTLKGFPASPTLAELRRDLRSGVKIQWSDAWQNTLLPVFEDVINGDADRRDPDAG